MAFTLDDVQHLAHLARLKLSDEEIATYHAQLSDILAYFDVLQDLDVSDIAATASILPHDTVMRGDQPKHGLEVDDLLRNLDETDKEGDQFRVNAILEEE